MSPPLRRFRQPTSFIVLVIDITEQKRQDGQIKLLGPNAKAIEEPFGFFKRANPDAGSSFRTSALAVASARLNGSLRRQLVDCFRKYLRQLRRHFVWRYSKSCAKLLQCLETHNALDLGGRNGVILARSHPRSDDGAETLFFELIDEAVYAALLLDEAAYDVDQFGADIAAYETIQNTHSSLHSLNGENKRRLAPQEGLR